MGIPAQQKEGDCVSLSTLILENQTRMLIVSSRSSCSFSLHHLHTPGITAC
jgi:hypothetical protein